MSFGDVELPANPSGLGETWSDWMDYAQWTVEENSCPGTRAVGAAIERQITGDNEKSACWGCNMRGKNEIVEVDGKPVNDG